MRHVQEEVLELSTLPLANRSLFAKCKDLSSRISPQPYTLSPKLEPPSRKLREHPHTGPRISLAGCYRLHLVAEFISRQKSVHFGFFWGLVYPKKCTVCSLSSRRSQGPGFEGDWDPPPKISQVPTVICTCGGFISHCAKHCTWGGGGGV